MSPTQLCQGGLCIRQELPDTKVGPLMTRFKITVARAIQALQGRSVPSGYFWN